VMQNKKTTRIRRGTKEKVKNKPKREKSRRRLRQSEKFSKRKRGKTGVRDWRKPITNEGQSGSKT